MPLPDYNVAPWIREGTGSTAETRPMTVEDYEGRDPSGLYTDYRKLMGLSSVQLTETQFYATWGADWRQKYLDIYEMKRHSFVVSARKECSSSSFRSSSMEKLMNFSGGNPPNIRVANGFGGTVPKGKYFLISHSSSDERGGKCIVRATWQMVTAWERVKLEND